MYNKDERGNVMKIKDSKGITMVALVVTVIVIMILAGITVYMGTGTIRNTALQTFKTNMLLIEAKAREYVENASYDLGVKPAEATPEMINKAKSELKGTPTTESDKSKLQEMGIDSSITNTEYVYIYKLSTDDLREMGINDVDSDDTDGWYIVIYNIPDVSVKVYNTTGFEISDGNTKYGLDDIRDIDTVGE